MWRTICRAASARALGASTSPTPSHEFWSKFRAFRETEGGIITEGIAKNLVAAFSYWGLPRLVDYGDHKAHTKLMGLHAELESEWERCDELEEKLKELDHKQERRQGG